MSRGIAARVIGDKFYKNGDEFVVEQSFISSIDKLDELKQSSNATDVMEFWPKKGKAKFSIGITLANNEERHLLVKHVADIGDGTGFSKWQNKEFTEQTGFIFNSLTAKKESLPYKPSNLVGDATLAIYDIRDIVCHKLAQLESEGKVHSGFSDKMNRAFDDLEHGRLPVFKDCLLEHAAIRDYIGEIIAPIAFSKNIGIEGISQIEILNLLDKKPEWLPLVKYQTNSNANLIDSSLVWPGSVEIGLSSKGGLGASASLFSLVSIFNKLETENPKKFKEISDKFKAEIEFLNYIFAYGIKAGPLVAGYLLGLINYRDLELLLEAFGQANILSDFPFAKKTIVSDSYDSNLYNFDRFGDTTLAHDCNRYKGKLSNDFFSLIDKRRVHDPSKAKFEYFALSSIAKAVAHEINTKEIRIGLFLETVLKSIHFIQIHAKTKAIGNDIHFVAFETIYPPIFKGRVLVEADKSFYSTKQPQGGFGFKLSA